MIGYIMVFAHFSWPRTHLFCHIFPPKLGPNCASSGPRRSWTRWQLVSGRVSGWPLQLGFCLSNTWGMTWGWLMQLGLPHRTWWFTSENGDFSHEHGELFGETWTNGDASEGTLLCDFNQTFQQHAPLLCLWGSHCGRQWSLLRWIHLSIRWFRARHPTGRGIDSWPSGNLRVCYWTWSIYRSFTYSTWWFSIVMLVYQRVWID